MTIEDGSHLLSPRRSFVEIMFMFAENDIRVEGGASELALLLSLTRQHALRIDRRTRPVPHRAADYSPQRPALREASLLVRVVGPVFRQEGRSPSFSPGCLLSRARRARACRGRGARGLLRRRRLRRPRARRGAAQPLHRRGDADAQAAREGGARAKESRACRWRTRCTGRSGRST